MKKHYRRKERHAIMVRRERALKARRPRGAHKVFRDMFKRNMIRAGRMNRSSRQRAKQDIVKRYMRRNNLKLFEYEEMRRHRKSFEEPTML